jgi:hypothetical protein
MQPLPLIHVYRSLGFPHFPVDGIDFAGYLLLGHKLLFAIKNKLKCKRRLENDSWLYHDDKTQKVLLAFRRSLETSTSPGR